MWCNSSGSAIPLLRPYVDLRVNVGKFVNFVKCVNLTLNFKRISFRWYA